MKTDRFVKVILVIIAGLLFLNCVKEVSFNNSNSPTTSRNGSTQSPNPTKTSIIETSVDAAPVPAFFQVGKTYNCGVLYQQAGLNYGDSEITIVNIDKESGWIQTKTGNWLNTSLFNRCSEGSAK